MKRVALYSPYVPKHSGGGEKYFLSIADVLSKYCEVTLLTQDSLVEQTREKLKNYSSIFGLDLSQVKVKATTIGTSKSTLHTMLSTRNYDVFFAMTDGSFFVSLAKTSYLIIQIPWTRPLSLKERIKLNTWKSILVYSQFCHDVLLKAWKVEKIRTVSPYVDMEEFSPADEGKKEKIILNVGRFFGHRLSNSKRQDILIEAFKKLHDHGIVPGYSLILVGNVDPGEENKEFVSNLHAQAKGYPVRIVTDASYTQLRSYYQKAQVYWHAAGFGVDEELHPENTEHFGITTLEAMASECIPFVVPKGGQKEILRGLGYEWSSIDELYEKMVDFSGLHAKQLELQRKQVRKRAESYSKEKFTQTVKELVGI